MKLSQRAMAMQPSATLGMAARARKLAAEGVDIVSFAVGEPDFDTPANIREAGKRGIDEGLTRYTPSAGIPELRAAVREKLSRDNGLDYAVEEIVITCGAKQAIYDALQVIVDPGDEVIVPAPYWVSYPDQVMLAGGVPRVLATEESNAFRIMPEALAEAITPRTRAIVLNYPSNPSGSSYGAKQLAAIGEVLADRGVAIISDEVYEKLLYTGEPHVSIAKACPRCRELAVVVNGVSKTYAMTGWRMGYAAGPKEIVSKIGEIVGQQNSGIPGFVQKACVEALTGPQEEIKRMRAEFRARRDLMLEGLASIRGMRCHVPDGAFYLLPNVGEWIGRSWKGRRIADASALADFLLDEAHVATVGGDPFGAPGFIRLSYATSRQRIEEGVTRISKALSKLA
ncbi:MAG: pyridoxal phosphate-dependent aminotransferase [Proteobacteria bacterium]|nr:pyridoxal phosphate-dependent aminotransferase [Pseudomonadota bacterium]